MLEYIVERDNINGCFVIRGNFNPNSIPVRIPEDDPDVKKFMDYFLYKNDVDEALNFLKCISIDKQIFVNKALFIAGLNAAMKGFKRSHGRIGVNALPKDDIITKYPDIKNDLKYFESLRDKHFIHDENNMIQTTAFLLLNPESETEKFGGPPSVVYNIETLDYYAESQKLQRLLHCIKEYIVSQIDRIGDVIYNRYLNVKYEELLTYGKPAIMLASTVNIDQNRNK